LLSWIASRGYAIWLENPVAIKRSLGLQRGKNDQVDAQRIAQYAARFADKAQLWQPPGELIEELKALMRMRERLLSAKSQLEVPLKESGFFMAQSKQKALRGHCRAALKGLKQSLDQIEQRMEALLSSEEQLKELYKVVSSVVGIGKITALELIIASNEFKGIKTAKCCACYAGVGPFEYTSASSIRGRSRVSVLANKPLKCLLHMGALAAVRVGGELKAYYQRKVKEGKNKMLVFNAVRNKLLARVYACVQEMRLYSRSYQVGQV
jgi:transposase